MCRAGQVDTNAAPAQKSRDGINLRINASEAVADAEFKAHRFALVVDYREQDLLLSAERLEMLKAAVIGVVLEGGCPAFGKIVGDPRRRRRIERPQTLERGVEDRIDYQIHRADATADDRPDLAGVAGRLPVPGIKAELEIDAEE